MTQLNMFSKLALAVSTAALLTAGYAHAEPVRKDFNSSVSRSGPNHSMSREMKANINNNAHANVDIHRKQSVMINANMIINISSLVPRPHLLSRGRRQFPQAMESAAPGGGAACGVSKKGN